MAEDRDQLFLLPRQLRLSRRNLRGLYRHHHLLRLLLKNWFSLDWRTLRYALRRQQHRPRATGSPLVVQSRDGKQFFACTTLQQCYFLMRAVQLAGAILGTDRAVGEVAAIFPLMQRIESRLRGAFSVVEVDRGAPGGWPAQKDALLYFLVRRYQPRQVLETGVAQGVSSAFILKALELNGMGRLTSIDLPNYDPTGLAYAGSSKARDAVHLKPTDQPGWVIPEELRARWTLLLGASRDILPGLAPSECDFFFHDSEHSYENMMFEYGWALGHLGPPGLLVSDDIERNRAFTEFTARNASSLTVLSARNLGVAVLSPPT